MTTTIIPPSDGFAVRVTDPRTSLGGRIRHSANKPHRWALAALLTSTAVLYLWNLSASGWANQFYAAAAQAGSKSWKAFLFGSLDQSNFITVDKPPASLWLMDLSMRIFGTNSWSLLVPQALEGVAAVALLYAAVRRVSTPTAGLLAGAALATTPVAALMFRFDNPDALLVLLMTAAAYATVRAVEKAGVKWLMLAGALIGFAFLTKMLQGLLVVPGLGIAYLVAAPTTLRRRLLHLLAAGGALIVAAGWWVALVELWPSGSRPYVGGSNHDSILELTFGYNGLGRLDGSSNNGNVGGGGGGFSSGQIGLTRLFGSEMGTQISWLLPAALVALVALGWLTWRRPRVDGLRASLIVWGGWVLVTGVVLSYASGIIHPYYTVALAPGIAALVGLGVVELWRARARWPLAVLLVAATWWTFELLGRSDWSPWLRWVVLLGGVLAVATVLAVRSAVLVAGAAAVALLAGPTAYAVQTAGTAHSGALPTAGPASSGGFGGRGPGGGAGGGPGGGAPGGARGGFGGAPNGAPGGTQVGPPTGGGQTGGGQTGGGGAAGGLGGASTVDSALATALRSGDYEWAAATTGSNEAASLELASGQAVMALGGFNGTDPAISLDAFKTLVAQGKVHYYIADSRGFIGSTAANTSTAYQIQQWVTSTFTATTIGGTTVYNLAGG